MHTGKITEGMVTGAIQIPPDGRPVVLGPDHATLGGYPVVAVVMLTLGGTLFFHVGRDFFPVIDGGQIQLPFVGPLILPPMGRRYPEGMYQLNRMQLYVNRGIGTVGLPFRLNCPPEITVITLNPA